jgi:hypothetical protein
MNDASRTKAQFVEEVREAVLAMRDSADLLDVVGVHQALHQLGVNSFSTSIMFFDDRGPSSALSGDQGCGALRL